MAYILTYLIGAVIGLVFLLVLLIKRRQSYWKSRGVYQEEQHLLYGDTEQLVKHKICINRHFRNAYDGIKSRGLRYGGRYMAWDPVLVVIDPTIIKNIIQTEFASFPNHGALIGHSAQPLNGHLFHLNGSKWKAMRTKLTPTFTSGKMKMMFETFIKCTEGLNVLIDNETKNGPVEICEVLSRFTTDIIGSCAFGLECNSMKDSESEFRKYGKKSFNRSKYMFLKMFALKMMPGALQRMLGIKMIPGDVEKFFTKVVYDTVEYRESNNIYRKDFMHLLIQLKNLGEVTNDENVVSNEKNKSSALTMDELAAQCFVFFVAGFETSSSAMSSALYELAINQNIQNKLRNEINEAWSKNNKFTYESIQDMSYLDLVVKETLRKHSPAPMIPRQCVKSYKIPDSDLVIEPGVIIHIPVAGLHMDPDYYPEPEKFDPERFTEENIAKRPQFTYLPFGEGPRICIGLRFGLLQTKVGIASILRNYKVTLNEKTEQPLTFDPMKIVKQIKNGLWLNFEKISS